jgi:hypothetical protein
MKIIEINSATVTLHEACLLVPEFKALYEKNKKDNGIQAFKYVYLFADYNSPYRAYDEEQKIAALNKDLNLTLTDELKAAIEKYKELNYSFNMRYLQDAIHAANQTRAYFRNVDYALLDARGNPIYKVKEVTDALKNTLQVITTLEGLKEKVESENVAQNKVRAGAKINKWEQ